MGDWVGCGGITKSFSLGSEDLADLVTGAGLGTCVTLGTDFLVLPVFLMFGPSV
jgi:hypothetical protein